MYAFLYIQCQNVVETNYDALPTIGDIVKNDNKIYGYIPKPITDSILINKMTHRDGDRSPLVNFILNKENKLPDSYYQREFLTSILRLPLVINTDRKKSNPYESLYDLYNKPILSLTHPKNENFYDKNLFKNNLFFSALNVLDYLQENNVSLFNIDKTTLDKYAENISISATDKQDELLINTSKANENIIQTVTGQYASEIKTKYWIPSFQTSIQFSENYVSDNWYKGGTSNLNLYMRNYFSLLYNRNDIQWINEIESKLNTYNESPSKIKSYRIADDQLRLSSNFGLKAINSFYYTIDGEMRTQIFNTYGSDNKTLRASFLAPMNLNVGLGMSYNYLWKSQSLYGRTFKFSLNVAPLSYTLRYSRLSNIDLKAFGLTNGKVYLNKFGSTIRANWVWNITMNISWNSKIYFNTTYGNIETEWENILDMAVSRYFSTRIYVNLRYDDSVPPSSNWNKGLQINQLLSFGITYKI